jgi:hypothetical protein
MRITDAGGDEQQASGFFAKRPSIMESIKPQSSMSATQEEVPKVNAEVNSAKLKQLLGKIRAS